MGKNSKGTQNRTETKNPITIIIDSNGLAHREAHKLDNLSWDEKKTGVIFGFLREILRLSKAYKTDKFIFCWDSQLSLRKEVYPDYKGNRKKNKLDPSIYTQFDTLRMEVLYEIGFNNIFIQEGYESDDLIAWIVIHYADDKFVIVTSDNDMYQLLFENEIHIYGLHTKKEFTERDFAIKYGILPNNWVDVKSIAGCKTDNVQGIAGVAVLTAIKYLKGELNKTSAAHKKIVSEDGKGVINRNKGLVHLPLIGTSSVLLREDNLNIDGFLNVCKRYGFSSFLYKENLSKWKELLMQ